MDERSRLRGLIEEWVCYLELRGQQVRRAPGFRPTLLSRNGRGTRYRWLFLVAEGPTRRLTAIEHENIARELRRAQRAGEQAYVVVKFEQPVGKVVVLSAAKAAKLGRVRAAIGGIPWD